MCIIYVFIFFIFLRFMCSHLSKFSFLSFLFFFVFKLQIFLLGGNLNIVSQCERDYYLICSPLEFIFAVFFFLLTFLTSFINRTKIVPFLSLCLLVYWSSFILVINWITSWFNELIFLHKICQTCIQKFTVNIAVQII